MEQKICIYCKKEIEEDERKYYSMQAGMKGLYHWKCFIKAVKINHMRNVINVDDIDEKDSYSY